MAAISLEPRNSTLSFFCKFQDLSLSFKKGYTGITNSNLNSASQIMSKDPFRSLVTRNYQEPNALRFFLASARKREQGSSVNAHTTVSACLSPLVSFPIRTHLYGLAVEVRRLSREIRVAFCLKAPDNF